MTRPVAPRAHAGDKPGDMARTGSLYERGVRTAHKAYKLTLSPLIGQSCRFRPTCSDYARDALIQHGLARGGWLTVRRLCKCHPFSGMDWTYDPVPPPPAKTEK